MILGDKWAFIHIPKTSGTNFQKRLLEENLAKDLHIQYSRHFTHQPLWWWESKIDLKDTEIFTIVRNPYVRFLSLYNHIHSNVDGIPDLESFIRSNQFENINSLIREQVGETWSNELSFDLFWPQHRFIESETKNVKIFKHENDLEKLEKIVGCNFTSTSLNRREYDRNLQTRYNKYTKSAIYSLYKEDFIRWEYSNELF